ncbi:MAG: hypothetical protein V4592_18135 [Bacteroidota bacterium]
MKTMNKVIIGVALASSMLAACAGSYYVSERPAEPVYTRPVAPYQGAVWVSGEWGWRNGRYVYTNGYWARARTNRVYVSGSWEQGPRGYYWRRGHWN